MTIDKAKKKEYNRDYSLENREKIRATKRRWEAANRQKLAEYRSRQREKNPRFTQEYALRRRYGISLEQWDEMVARQGGRCAICEEKKDLHVDHNHDTGLVRELLCRNCNTAIGFFLHHALLKDSTRAEVVTGYPGRGSPPCTPCGVPAVTPLGIQGQGPQRESDATLLLGANHG